MEGLRPDCLLSLMKDSQREKNLSFLCTLLQMKLQETLLEMQLTPFSILLRALLDQLQAKDQARIFTQPVDVSEVSDSRCSLNALLKNCQSNIHIT